MLLSHTQLFEPIDLSRRLFRKITRVTPRSEILFGLSSLDIGRPFRDLDVSYRPVELRRSIELTLGERRTVRVSNVEFYRSATEKAYLEVEIHPLLDNDARALRPWASTS